MRNFMHERRSSAIDADRLPRFARGGPHALHKTTQFLTRRRGT
jgi:hypothetical protein